jgi:hypothetical protein
MVYCIRLSLLFCLFALPLLGQPLQREAEKERIAGWKIRTSKSFSLKLNHDIDKRTLLDCITRYDTDGNETEQVYYDSTGLEMLKWTHLYARGRQYKQILCIYRDTVACTYRYYNEKGFPKEEITENGEGLPISKMTFTCNSKGRILEAHQDIFPASAGYVKQAYKYDTQGFLILRFIGDNVPVRNLQFVYGYSKKGQLEKITQLSRDTIPAGWITYDYTRGGQLKSMIVKHPGGKRYNCNYYYDSHERLQSELKNYSLNALLIDQEKDEYICDRFGIKKKRLRYKMNKELDMLYNYEYEFYP